MCTRRSPSRTTAMCSRKAGWLWAERRLSSPPATRCGKHISARWLSGYWQRVSDRRIAAVDEQVGAGHEARGVARKIEGRASDLLGLAETSDRVLRHSLSASVRHAAVTERDALGLDGARRQRVDTDVVARVVDGHHLGELDQRALGRAVDAPARRTDPAHLRGDVNDATATGIGHVRDDGTAHEIGTREIDGDGSVPVGRLEL